jgi:hypothetical protein
MNAVITGGDGRNIGRFRHLRRDNLVCGIAVAELA